ncbi:MAG: hypothetical protein FWG56_03100 [Desulfovibrionaceae bacterium]|jgi:hypothetical protein|nr:hypothetical protein [Desulfovibrionaceae bacterium]
MIDVHALTSAAIQQVNADTPVLWLRSTGEYANASACKADAKTAGYLTVAK